MRLATRRFRRLLVSAAALVAALAGRALDAQTPAPGAKAMGMGGTFVAAGNDATALWGNPAGLVECTLGCATLFGGASAADQNAFLRTLRDDFEGIDPDNLTPAQIAKLVQALAGLENSGTGAIGSGVAGLGYALHGFGIGIGATVYGGAYPNLILVPEGPFVGPSLDSTVTLKGIEARELRVGYAGGSHGFTIGGDIRYVQGRTYVAIETLEQAADDPISVLRDAFRKNERRTDKVTFDLGATFHALAGRLRLGIVGQSLNEPELDFADGSRAPLPRTIRAGAAFAPVSFDGIVF
ncbi:MAG TPA: conjugal transfer protein TraF, partial [Thermoanaerobaculia bacterium]|nr:conjugal transfer protein TraF [Thermoanaerobaculia bacterium]